MFIPHDYVESVQTYTLDARTGLRQAALFEGWKMPSKINPHVAGFTIAVATLIVVGLIMGSLRRSTRKALLAVLETPSWLIGEILGSILFVLLPLAAIPLAILAYRLVLPREPEKQDWVRLSAASTTAWLVGLFGAMVLYRSTHWMAFTMLERAKDSDY